MSDLAGLGFGELEAELATLAAHLYAGTCRWLELVAELDRRSGFELDGQTSSAAWLAWRCGLTPRAAREHVRVARSLAGLPATRAAFRCGELSYAKVRALTRVATAGDEQKLLGLARELTAAQLERAVRAYRRVTMAEAREQLEAAYLSVSWAADGCLELHGRLAPEDGALLLRALEAMRDRAWQDGGSAEPRPQRQVSKAEALVAVADAALAHGGEGRPGGERYQVVVHADEATLTHDGEGGCALEDGSALAPETTRRLACDATILHNGHRSRAIPPATQRALRTRDRGCRFPGCHNRRFVDAHHIRHWAKGGQTKLDNLLLLCRHHHRAVHEGRYTVDQQGRFHYPWGQQLPPAPLLPRSNHKQLLDRNNELDIHQRTYATGMGDPIDLGLAVDAILQAAARARSS